MSLQAILGTQEVHAFLRHNWGQASRALEGCADLTSLIDPASILSLAERGHLRCPRARVWHDDIEMDARAWTRSLQLGGHRLDGVVDADALRKVLDAGALLWVGALARIHAPAATLCEALARDLQLPVEAHLWHTSASAHRERVAVPLSQAAAHRFVLVMQGEACVGADDPIRDELRLAAGSAAYLAPGKHASMSVSAAATVVIVVMQPVSWGALLEGVARQLLASLTDDETLRRADRSGAQTQTDVARFACVLRERWRAQPWQQAQLRHFLANHEERAGRGGRLRTLTALLRGDPDAVVQGRPQRVLAEREDAHGVHLVCDGKEIAIPRTAAAAVKFMLRTEPYRIADVPGKLTCEQRMALARELASAGLVTLAEETGGS
jgi:hypothetical protein